MKKLKTTLPSYINGKYVGEYTASVYRNDKGTVIVRITPCEGTAGHWEYQLISLLQIDDWAIGKPSDRLCLDLGQEWEVTNMLALYREIIRKCMETYNVSCGLEKHTKTKGGK